MTPVTFVGAARRSFAFLIIGLYAAYDTVQQQQRFKTEAHVADGMVLTKSIRRNKNSSSFWASYRFPAPDGTTLRHEVKVSARLWDQLVERERVHVTYLASDPKTNRLEGAGPDWVLPGVFTLLGLVFAPIGGVIFFKGVRGIMRQLRLQTEGTRADATVVEVEPANVSFNGVPQWQIRYRYQDHRGRTHGGQSGVMAPEEAEPWKVGDTGVIRFDPHAPKKSFWVGRA